MEEDIFQPQGCRSWCDGTTSLLFRRSQEKTPDMDGKPDEQVTNELKEGRQHTPPSTARRSHSKGDCDHSGTDRTPRMLLRRTNVEVNMGKGRTAQVKQQQWKPCSSLIWDLAWCKCSAFCGQLENLQPFHFHQKLGTSGSALELNWMQNKSVLCVFFSQ